MSRNDVVMTPLRVKQAIDGRFVKPSEDELNVLINGTWVEFVKVVDEADGWYDTLGFTEFIDVGPGLRTDTNTVRYTPQEVLNILPFHVKWHGSFTDVETGEPTSVTANIISIVIGGEILSIRHNGDYYERIVQIDDLPDLSEEKEFYEFRLQVSAKADVSSDVFMDGYFEIRENDDNGVVLGHYPLQYTVKRSCYLTSAMVDYYGKLDDGIELTAMRRLREIYAEKRAETLKTYYADSAIIISEIERLDMQDHYYGRIKDVVDEIVIHVDNENWSVAEELYLDLYYGLKDELQPVTID